MTRIFEDPMPAVWLCLFALACLLMVYTQTKKQVWLLAMLLAGFLGFGMVMLERYVITDREEVEAILIQTADAIESNDIQTALRALAPEEQALRSKVERYMPDIEMEAANFTSEPKIEVDMDASPPTASAKFQCIAHGKYKTSGMKVGTPLTNLEVTLEKRGDQWFVTRVEGIDRIGKP